MNRADFGYAEFAGYFLRTRGGEPFLERRFTQADLIFSAHAEVNRARSSEISNRLDFLRTRGGEPKGDFK